MTDDLPQAARPCERRPPAEVVTSHEVSLKDVDFLQAHFAAYFGWVDVAFQHLLQANGSSFDEMMRSSTALPLVRIECDYITPLSVGTRFDIRSAVTKVGRTSFQVTHRLVTKGNEVATVVATHVHIETGVTPAPTKVPSWVRGAYAASLERAEREDAAR